MEQKKNHGNKKNKSEKRSNHKQSGMKKDVQNTMRTTLIQPVSSWASLEDIPHEDIGKDFQSLINAPMTEGGHFVFKSEKSWNVNVSEHLTHFTLDLKMLSAAIHSIPFNEYMNIEEKYLTVDQQTNIQNTADAGEQIYKELLANSTVAISRSEHEKISTKDEVDNTEEKTIAEDLQKMDIKEKNEISDSSDVEEDLDFLLSLKEPVKSDPISIVSSVISSDTKELKIQSKSTPNKPVNLEKWLDSVLDD